MIEAATDVLIARSHAHESWTPVVVLSLVAHALAVSSFIFMPAVDLTKDVPKTVMTISLGGAPGPRAGGMSPIGGRTVQEIATEPSKRAEAPPATKAPEMTLPSKNARTRQETKTEVAAKESAGRTTTKGAEIQQGSARAETGARGQGFGLSTGGGGGAGAYLDVGTDFCCPDYLETVVQLIQRNWNSKQNMVAQAVVKVTIERNGMLTNVQLEKPSGFSPLDLAAQRALLQTQQVPPLPRAYTNPSLTLHFIFEYQR